MREFNIAVIGLGYVGLPLAVEFAKKYQVTGFDISEGRVSALRDGNDHTLAVETNDLHSVLKTEQNSLPGFFVTSLYTDISEANIYIVTVPTPVDRFNRPELRYLHQASETVARVLKKGDVVVYESTVYPGATEEECVPVLEKVSGLEFNTDFFVGYSPERTNQGDKEHTVSNIKKLVGASNEETLKLVSELYGSIVKAGIYSTSSIRVAEAAKVIENAQRDINIAFVNELAIIFNRLDIDTAEVLAAAATKWNFLPFKPGLVGGHCIGVDPYYLAQKAIESGYHPEIILAGRRLNDSMGAYVADEVIKLMLTKGIEVIGSRALILGITFKENCTDVRNSKVIDIISQLGNYHVKVDVMDPWANAGEVFREFGITLAELPSARNYDAVILAVAHREFTFELITQLCSGVSVVYDVKSVLEKNQADARL
jgi:UDP-N-acetyl-D-galactosamine dehydrogenase